MREIKPAPQAPEAVRANEEYQRRKNRSEARFSVEVITPLYGGGAALGINDPDFPIRSTSVRGQLRFWWRATRGAAQCETPEALFKREREIWGSADTPSSTVIEVRAPEWKNLRKYIGPRDNNYGFGRFGSEAYVLFPASAETSRHNLMQEGLQFEIKVSFEKNFEKDVFCAFWAWANFGGLGARTRRGCGALFCKELAPARAALESVSLWLKRGLTEYGLNLNVKREWPVLSSQILTGAAKTTSMTAWSDAVAPMKNFRQGVGVGRNRGSKAPNRPGRSFWPEPDTLRRATGRNNPEHKPSPEIPDGFPRAMLGLPIVFHFAGSRGDPESELYPKGKKRMGSPFILRPLKGQDGQSAPMTVLLRTLVPKELELKGTSKTFDAKSIVNPKFAAYRNAPMRGRSRDGNAIEAFIAYLKEQRFVEVKL